LRMRSESVRTLVKELSAEGSIGRPFELRRSIDGTEYAGHSAPYAA